MPDHRVNILLKDGVVEVNPEEVHVSFSRGESVIWFCAHGEAQIDFVKQPKGSPFLSGGFHVPGGGFVGSGPPLRGKIHERYKYTVTVTLPNDRREYVRDPEVLVENG